MFAGPNLLTRVYRRLSQEFEPEGVDASAAAGFDLHGGFPIVDCYNECQCHYVVRSSISSSVDVTIG